MIPSAYAIPGLPNPSVISKDRLIDCALKVFHTTREEIESGTRMAEPKMARQVIMWYTTKFLNYSLSQAGGLFKLTHTTVLNGNKRVSNYMDTDSNFNIRVKIFKEYLRLI